MGDYPLNMAHISSIFLFLIYRTRIPRDQVYYHRSIEYYNGVQDLFSFNFCFDIETDVYQFALAFPYSYTRLQTFLNDLDSADHPCYRRNCVAYTIVSFC